MSFIDPVFGIAIPLSQLYTPQPFGPAEGYQNGLYDGVMGYGGAWPFSSPVQNNNFNPVFAPVNNFNPTNNPTFNVFQEAAGIPSGGNGGDLRGSTVSSSGGGGNSAGAYLNGRILSAQNAFNAAQDAWLANPNGATWSQYESAQAALQQIQGQSPGSISQNQSYIGYSTGLPMFMNAAGIPMGGAGGGGYSMDVSGQILPSGWGTGNNGAPAQGVGQNSSLPSDGNSYGNIIWNQTDQYGNPISMGGWNQDSQSYWRPYPSYGNYGQGDGQSQRALDGPPGTWQYNSDTNSYQYIPPGAPTDWYPGNNNPFTGEQMPPDYIVGNPGDYGLFM